jgi:gluconokinase
MSRHEPQAFASTCRWCSLAEFLEARWFGPEAASSLSMASGSGLLDQFRREWDPELLEVLGLPEGVLARPLVEPAAELSPAPGRQGQSLLPLFARRWPALAGVPWLPARGDGAAAVVGSGCLSGDGQRIRAALTVGTSAAIRLVVPWRVRAARPLAPALFAYLLDDRRAVVGVARSNAGSLVSWARRVLWLGEELRGDDFTIDPVEVATKDRFPGGHGLLADASLGGERSPRWPADARGTLAGLRTDTSAWDILQALLEASVVGLADGVDALEAWGGRFTVVLSGGGARSAGWHHLLADALDREVVVSQIDESSSRGAALAAMEKFGWLAEDALGPMDASVAKPDKERAAAFAGLRALSRTVGTEGPAN